MSNAKMRASLYRSNCEAMRPSRVDFPEPVGPRTSVCPTSPSWRFSLKGVEPMVAACRSAGLRGGKCAEGQ